MIEHIEEPVACAEVEWLPPEANGRRSGPPTAQVYAANCVFPLGGEAQVTPVWPANAEKFSVLLERIHEFDSVEGWRCHVDFIAHALVAPYLYEGATMLITEGPKIVATSVIRSVDHEILQRKME